jgi:hypothetical protein
MSDTGAIRAEILQEEDVVRVVLDQHQQILDMFGGLRAASGDARTGVLRELRALLVVHETAEQIVVRPVTSNLIGSEFVGALGTAETELTNAASQLEDVRPEHGQFDENLDALEAMIVDHFFTEESEELPVLLDQGPIEDRLQMGRRLLAAAKVLPTRPHPTIDNAGTAATLLAAPLTSIVDRARDAIARESSAPSESS